MVFQRSPRRRNDFDSSEDEDNEAVENATPFHVDWVDLPFTGCCAEVVCISGLPGCKYKGTNRNLSMDIAHLKAMDITDVLVFCSPAELARCKVPYLIDEYHHAGIDVCHFPIECGNIPTMSDCDSIIAKLRNCISFGHKTLLHCVSGWGVSCLAVAILMLRFDAFMTPDYVITKLRQLRGQQAFQTIKQYNFVHEFRDLHKAHLEEQRNISKVAPPRSLSR
ncbi:cyclin-dependent kinase inhibitor 3-like [Montipora foliosa]|uniref:cyclin-dependent kinase inhibitor 3-like n=1 Tax=Montipora foliosa TaxID=591990 RepID=UPI0035F2120F